MANLAAVTAGDGTSKKDIALGNDGNALGSLKATGKAVTVKEDSADGLALDDVAADALTVTAKGDVTQVAGKKVEVANLAAVTATGDITMTQDNDFQGAVTASGKSVKLNDVNNISLNDIAATDGGVAVAAESIAVNGEVKAQGSGDSANVLLNATGADGVTLDADVTAAKNVSVIADAGTIKQNANITAQDGTVDVDAKGALDMAAAATTKATGNILYVGNGGSVDGTLEAAGEGAGLKIVGTAVGGGASLSADAIVLSVTQLGTTDNSVSLNASKLAVEAPGGIYVNNGREVEIIAVDEAAATDFKVNRVRADLATEEHGFSDGTGAVDGLSAADGDIVLNNKGSIAVSATVSAKDVTLTATDGGDLAVNAGKSLTATEGDVVLTADKDIAMSGTVKATAGAVEMTAKNAVGVTDAAEVEAGTSVTVKSTDAGDITIDTTKGVTAKGGSVTIDNASGKVTIQNAAVAAKGDAGSVDVSAASGSITVKDATVAADNNIRLATTGESGGDVTIDTGVTMTAGNNATVESVKGVEIRSDVSAGGDEAKAGRDAVVIAHGGKVKMAAGTTLGAGRHVVIEATDGVELATINASADEGTVAVKTSGGNITDVNGDNAPNVTAKNAAFVATNGTVGEGGNHIDTSVDVVAATAKSGVFLTEADGVSVGEVAAVSVTKVTASGEEEYSTTLVSGLASTENGPVVLEATAGDIAVDQAVDASGSAGNVLVAANDGSGSVTVNAAVSAAQSATLTAGKDVALNANVTAVGGDASVEAQGGDVTMKDGTTVNAQGNSARIAAKGDVELSKVEAANVSVKADTGSVVDALSAETANVTATKLRLEAGGTVGKDADALNTSVANLEVKAAGDVFLEESDGVTIGGVDGVDAKKVGADGLVASTETDAGVDGVGSTDGDVRVKANGTMNVAEEVSAAGNVRLEATAGDMSVDAAVDGRNVTLAAGDSVTTTVKGLLAANDGDLYVKAEDGIALDGDAKASETLALVAGTGKIDAKGDLNSKALFTSAGGVTTLSGDVVADSLAISSSSDVKINLAKDATVAIESTGGSVEVTSSANVTVGQLSGSAGGFTVTEVTWPSETAETSLTGIGGAGSISGISAGKDVTVKTTGGNVTVETSVAAQNGPVTLDASGEVTVDGSVSAANDNVDIKAGADVTVAGTVKADGAVAMTAKNAIDVTGTAEVEAGTSVTVKSTDAGDITIDTTKGVTAKGGSVTIDNDSGKVTILNAAVSASAKVDVDATDAVTIAKGSRSASVTGGTGVEIDTTANGVAVSGSTVTARTGDVVVGTDKDTRIGGSFLVQNSADVKAAGNVNVFAGDNVVITGISVIEAGKDVVVDAGGSITQDGVDVGLDEKGYVAASSPRSAIVAAGKAELTAGKSIGEAGNLSYVGVSADSVTAKADGDVAIAGGAGKDLVIGGDGITGKNVALYSSNSVRTDGRVSGESVSVAAHDFGGSAPGGGLRVAVNGGTLTTYNHRGGLKPMIAAYKNDGGNDNPKVSNLPNGTIVFLDGRLIGGDTKTLNTLGALEAFPVQTPELKSEQGIFGNPSFIHGEMGIANAVAVGAIDFVLLDQGIVRDVDYTIPIDSDLRAKEIDEQIDAIGKKTSIRFASSDKQEEQSFTPEQGQD